MKTSYWIACGVSAFISACGGGSDPTSVDVEEKTPPVPGPVFSILIPAGTGCSFALLVEGTGGKRVINEKGLRIIEAGKGSTLTYSRVDDSDPNKPIILESVTFETNGSVTKTIPNPADADTNLVTATGHNAFVLFPTDIPPGPSTQLFIGRVEYIINPKTFDIQILNSTGRKIDICQIIAP